MYWRPDFFEPFLETSSVKIFWIILSILNIEFLHVLAEFFYGNGGLLGFCRIIRQIRSIATYRQTNNGE